MYFTGCAQASLEKCTLQDVRWRRLKNILYRHAQTVFQAHPGDGRVKMKDLWSGALFKVRKVSAHGGIRNRAVSLVGQSLI